jgi:hypothetical protein
VTGGCKDQAKKGGKVIQRRSITGASKRIKTTASHDRSSSVGWDQHCGGSLVGNGNGSTVNSTKPNKKCSNFTEELVHMLNLKINKKKAKCKN